MSSKNFNFKKLCAKKRVETCIKNFSIFIGGDLGPPGPPLVTPMFHTALSFSPKY